MNWFQNVGIKNSHKQKNKQNKYFWKESGKTWHYHTTWNYKVFLKLFLVALEKFILVNFD